MRNAFADEITKLSKSNKKIVLLSGDIGNKMFDRLKQNRPNQFYNCGVAEANMMSLASGLGLDGLIPIVYTITPFTTTRCLEQIKIGVCYHNSPVIIVGTGSGLSYAQLGPTHHSLEDISIMRSMPNMIVFCPSDPMEVRLGLREAIKIRKPIYIRLGKKGEPIVNNKKLKSLSFSKPIKIKNGTDICILSSGSIISLAVEAINKLKDKNIRPEVYSYHTVKPINKSFLNRIFEKFRIIFTLEEHNYIGGLNSSLAEWVVENKPHMAHKLKRFSMEDKFYSKVTSQENLRNSSKISVKKIISEIIKTK